MEMAVHRDPVAVGMVAGKYAIPEGALAHALQALVRAGIARGVRGVGGGYVLSRDASSVSVLDVVAVFDAVRSGPAPAVRGDALAGRLRALFDEVDEIAANTLASVTLATLTRELPRRRA